MANVWSRLPEIGRFGVIREGLVFRSMRLASDSSTSGICTWFWLLILTLPAGELSQFVLPATFRSSSQPPPLGEFCSLAPTGRNETELDARAIVVEGTAKLRRGGLPEGSANAPAHGAWAWTEAWIATDTGEGADSAWGSGSLRLRLSIHVGHIRILVPALPDSISSATRSIVASNLRWLHGVVSHALRHWDIDSEMSTSESTWW